MKFIQRLIRHLATAFRQAAIIALCQHGLLENECLLSFETNVWLLLKLEKV